MTILEEECIADVKVFGVPDDFWRGEIVVDAIVLKDVIEKVSSLKK